jgi:hypothetical protein
VKRIAWLFLLAVASCSSKETAPPAKACASLVAGNLVITEIMPNPAGEDSGKEWFEVFNSTGRELDVAGLELFASKLDLTEEREHTVRSLKLPPAIRCSARPRPTPCRRTWTTASATTLGALRNDAGRIGLRCDTTVLDVAVYATVRDGASRSLSGALTPDPSNNDVEANWCDATVENSGIKGSPGAANESCGGNTGSTCEAGGTRREIDYPAAGEIVISEIMPNPKAVADDSGEWIELTLLADADLNGLELGTTAGTVRTTVASAECLHVAAGSRVVLARVADAQRNGALPPVAATFNFDLANAGGTLFVGARGAVLDQITWTGSGDGASTSLDPAAVNPTTNDDEARWCRSTSSYGDGDLGTPGLANDDCPDPLPPGMCMDGGSLRATVQPAVGDLVITEILANAAGADDGKEWFEVLVKRAVDLNGVELGTAFPTVAQKLESAGCLRVQPGTYLVFSHNDGASPDGGLPKVDFRTRFDLGNASPALFLAIGGVLLDGVSLATAPDGASWSLTPESLDPTSNDDRSKWCTAASPYGEGDNNGTPGALNFPGCADPDHCVENGELRPTVAPQPGDLVISEVMPDPSQVGDEEGEWFEITVARDVDINGLQLGTVVGSPRLTIADAACRSVQAGTRLVFARNGVPAENGGLPAVSSSFNFALTNSNGSLFIARDGTLLDAVTWIRVNPAPRGRWIRRRSTSRSTTASSPGAHPPRPTAPVTRGRRGRPTTSARWSSSRASASTPTARPCATRWPPPRAIW